MSATLIFMIIMTFIGQSMALNPGVKMRVTQNGLNYANGIAKVALAKLLSELKLDDIEGKDGKSSYWLKNFQTSNVVSPDIHITSNPGQRGLTCSITNFGIDLRADYRVKTKQILIPISVSGSITASLGGASLIVTLGIDQFEDTSPKLISRSCNANIGDFNIKFHGKAAWLLNLLKGIFKNRIKNILRNKICENVQKAINTKAADKLRKLRLNTEIAGKFVVDYRLISPVLFMDRYLEILNKGDIRWKTDTQSPIPFSPDPIPAWDDNSNMFYLWLTEYTPRTLAYAAHTHGYLQYLLTADKLADKYKGYLNTTCLHSACVGSLIPKLAQDYPNSAVSMKMESREVPQVNITSQGLGLALFGVLDMSTTTAASVLTANLSVSFVGTANVQGDRIIGEITKFSVVLESINSKVGDIDVKKVNLVLEEVIELWVLPQLNDIAKVGVLLPIIPDLTLQNPRIIYQEKAVLIGTDVKYHDNVLSRPLSPPARRFNFQRKSQLLLTKKSYFRNANMYQMSQ